MLRPGSRGFVGAIAALNLAVLAAAVVVAASRDDAKPVAGGADQSRVSAPSATLTSGPSAVSGASTPAASVTAAPSSTPSASPTARLTASASATATTSPRSYPFPSPTTTYAPLTVTTLIKPAADGTTQTNYTLSVHLRDGDGDAYVSEVAWGDGTTWHHEPIPMVMCPIYTSPTANPGPYKPSPSDVTVSMRHAWRSAGSYTITVKAFSGGNSCAPYAPSREEATAAFDLDVADDDVVTSNGPADPAFTEVDALVDSSRRRLDLSGNSYDSDGFVSRVVVDWGDGSANATFTQNLSHCDDNDGASYPAGDQWGVRPYFTHTYAKRGTYIMTVTVTSVGCDGEDVQTGLAKGKVKI